MGYLWMKVTSDEYELPEAVADTGKELARICGISYDTLLTSVSREKHGKLKKSVYKKVKWDDDDGER